MDYSLWQLSLVRTRPSVKSRTYNPLEFPAEEGETPPPCSVYSCSPSLSQRRPYVQPSVGMARGCVATFSAASGAPSLDIPGAPESALRVKPGAVSQAFDLVSSSLRASRGYSSRRVNSARHSWRFVSGPTSCSISASWKEAWRTGLRPWSSSWA